jgi:spoIIIJ-associated protein
MEWVEVRGRTVEEAVSLGLQELGLDSAEAAEIEVLKEPQRGFLGIGAQDALVRIKPRPRPRRRHRRARSGAGEAAAPPPRGRAQSAQGSGGGRSRGRGPERRGARGEGRGGAQGRPGSGERRQRSSPRGEAAPPPVAEEAEVEQPAVAVEQQAEIVRTFLVGLLNAFGLEGEVATRVEGDIVYADVSGEQTEALIGPKGSILDAVLELCRTMVHRQSQAGARLRLDIGGYGERRREALRIYAGRLAAKVLEDGGEVMLEPMNAADRKVVHDAVAEIEGVRSYSEGEDPGRSVVIARSEEAPGEAEDDKADLD